VYFSQAGAERLVNELRQVRFVNERGELRETLSEYVEPVLLQVVCHHIWEQLPPNETLIDTDYLKSAGDIDRILEGITQMQCCRQQAKLGCRSAPFANGCERELITAAGTRTHVIRGAAKSSGLPN
jgi:hypothetical protein